MGLIYWLYNQYSTESAARFTAYIPARLGEGLRGVLLIWLWSGSEEPPVQRIELDITIQFQGLNPISVPRGSEVEPPAAQPASSDENDAIRQMLRDSFNLVDVRAATS